MRALTWAAALAALAACAAQTPKEELVILGTATAAANASATAPADPPPPAARAAIGDFGVDRSAGDPSVRPGDDFFAYANGTWYTSFVIPSDHSSYGPFNVLEELSTERVRGIIEAAAAAHPAAGTPGQQIGDYY